jgi:hypothetical protein
MVKDRFIPEARTFNLAAPTLYRKGPLYTLPNLLLYKAAAVVLGIARGAIDDFIALASNKPLTFRSPSASKAMLRDETYAQCALAHPGADGRAVEVADPRADVERRTLLRYELHTLQRAAHGLTSDQRLVLACQIALQMSAAEFCATFGWSAEKHRKVAQRARARLRRLAGESIVVAPARDTLEGAQSRGGKAKREAGRGTFENECPVRGGESEEKTGTLL